MYPPETLVRFSRRLTVRSIRPGGERFFKVLTVFWMLYIPVVCVLFVASIASPVSGPAIQLSLANSILIGIYAFCSQSAFLAEESRPLLSAWLRVSALAAWLLFATVFGVLLNEWFGWIGAVLWTVFVFALVAVELRRFGRGLTG